MWIYDIYVKSHGARVELLACPTTDMEASHSKMADGFMTLLEVIQTPCGPFNGVTAPDGHTICAVDWSGALVMNLLPSRKMLKAKISKVRQSHSDWRVNIVWRTLSVLVVFCWKQWGKSCQTWRCLAQPVMFDDVCTLVDRSSSANVGLAGVSFIRQVCPEFCQSIPSDPSSTAKIDSGRPRFWFSAMRRCHFMSFQLRCQPEIREDSAKNGVRPNSRARRRPQVDDGLEWKTMDVAWCRLM